MKFYFNLRLSRLASALIPVLLLLAGPASFSAHADSADAQQVFTKAWNQALSVAAPAVDVAPQTFSTTLKIVQAAGLPREVIGREATLAFQAPDRLKLSATVDGETYSVGRNRSELWLHAEKKGFGLRGSPNVPRFRTAPGEVDCTTLPPLRLPVSREQLQLVPLFCKVEGEPEQEVHHELCHVLRVTPRPEAESILMLSPFTLTCWLRQSDLVPLRLRWADGKGLELTVDLDGWKLEPAWPEKRWDVPSRAGQKIETVPLGHLTRFLEVALSGLNEKVPEISPAEIGTRLLARHGLGRREIRDGTRVVFLKGTPEEMGAQHGRLMKTEVRHLVDRVLYGVGVGSSLGKSRWFFGEIEDAQARLMPFMDERYLREIKALAASAELRQEEILLANFFPELFHCSGFVISGDATVGGRMYHGRILDYLRGVGLEQNATVFVVQPDQGNAWVNVGYAGFVGTVTAMNEKHLAIGEMGGRGEGRWDGKPMAQLMRDVMEKADTIEQAVDLLRRAPRTCEYYYVISDGKTKRAVGIAATPDKFETIWAGDSHPLLPHAMKDTVLMSAGDRYETLAQRVKAGYGRFDAKSARELMTRPVCMTSNIQSVLFSPDTLDFWVATADAKNVAGHSRYVQYNLAELLKQK